MYGPARWNFHVIDLRRHDNFHDMSSNMNSTNYMMINDMSYLYIFMFFFTGLILDMIVEDINGGLEGIYTIKGELLRGISIWFFA